MQYVLKKDIFCDILFIELRWNSVNNNVLISTSILNALWEREQKDTIDLLLPFFKYSIAKNTNAGEALNTKKIVRYFKDEFGYDSIPSQVVKIMLGRLTPKILSKQDNEYYLKASLSDEIERFDRNRILCKEHSSKVILSLSDYLNQNYIIKSFTEENTYKALIAFFVLKGICLIKEVEALNMIKSCDDKLNYCIAQFILQERDKDSAIFSYIVDMVKGFFISSAIYLQPDNESVTSSKFKNLRCYLDTPIILNVLGLKTTEEKNAASEFIQMLKNENANICVFKHNMEEVSDIIYAYKMCLQDPLHNKSFHTLEYFDEKKYKTSDVERYLLSLQTKIEKLGIEIVESPDFDEFTIDEQVFSEHIKENISYRNDKALARDIDSVVDIYRLRKGKYAKNIERCRHVFVSPNIRLVNATNCFFKQEIGDNFPLFISDQNLSAISWLKSYSTNKDYPKSKLIENAISLLEPSPQLLSLFFEKIEILTLEGGISEEDAAVYRTSLFCKRELVKATQGDPQRINEKMLCSIFDEFKNQLSEKERRKSSLNYQKYQEERESTRKHISNALSKIKHTGEISERQATYFLWVVFGIIFSLLLIIGLVSIVFAFTESDSAWGFGLICLFIDIAGLLDLFLSKRSAVKKVVSFLAIKYKDKRMDKKRKEYELIFDNNLGDK